MSLMNRRDELRANPSDSLLFTYLLLVIISAVSFDLIGLNAVGEFNMNLWTSRLDIVVIGES